MIDSGNADTQSTTSLGYAAARKSPEEECCRLRSNRSNFTFKPSIIQCEILFCCDTHPPTSTFNFSLYSSGTVSIFLMTSMIGPHANLLRGFWKKTCVILQHCLDTIARLKSQLLYYTHMQYALMQYRICLFSNDRCSSGVCRNV